MYVVVCRGPNCRARGALDLRRRLVKLLHDDPDVHLIGYSCFGQCDYGPNVAFFPPGTWYGALSHSGDAERVVAHARGIEPILEPPLDLPEAEQTEHTRNIGRPASHRLRPAPGRRHAFR